ncbi:MAG: SDR family NAD(P)-dependent oxidoreductase [Nodularia sp. (in: cyanobacteria)]|nr:SDR family NAD(P)-dependent oxidoreductase [Nodularia sp. (in: cyanobacteria)]
MKRKEVLSVVIKHIRLNIPDPKMNLDVFQSIEDLGGSSFVINTVVSSAIEELLIDTDNAEMIDLHKIKNINELVDKLLSIKNKETLSECCEPDVTVVSSQKLTLLQQLPSVAPEERSQFWINHIHSEIVSILGLPPSYPLNHHQGFFEMGMTSLMVIALQDRLQASLEDLFVIPSSSVFDYPTIETLANYLLANVLISEDMVSYEQQPIYLQPDQAIPLQSNIKTSKDSDAIAIIGMGCRFPGEANNPEAFWQLIQTGIDATIDIPTNRWQIADYYDSNPDIPGKMYSRRGGFLDDVDQFDAEFFGISPREAVNLDPQQRLLLEVSWEALEHAGQPPKQLEGSQTGIFIGLINADYAKLQVQTGDSTQFNAYYGTGTALSAAAGRLSYFLGLQGPAMVVDTACSSSLVTVHLACQSLRNGESNLALAGGCNLILAPDSSIYLSQTKAISPDGRCKTFDATANGYGRGEGCGIVVLKRLADAVADGDQIWAVIRGSAVNHDGYSSGFTVPNGLAQEALLRQALNNARVEPHQVSYVEAHGTGTPLGDPIEVRALGSVFARSNQEPLKIGSVKTNIGHLESAAGIAGLIKVVLSLHHAEIPPHLHLNTLNPRISLQAGQIEIPTKPTPWPDGLQSRIAGVSSFGLSGTNAHVVLAAAPEISSNSSDQTIERPLHILTLSAKTEAALRELAQRYQQYLVTHSDESIANICYTANTGRSHFCERLAIIAESTSQLQTQLTKFIDNQPTSTQLYTSIPYSVSRKIAFVFPGNGFFPGMGDQLYKTQPKFQKAFQRCNQILQPLLGESLEAIFALKSSKLSSPGHFLGLFALEYALAELWQSWGIKPDVVVGFGVGELVAACVTGVLTLEDCFHILLQKQNYQSLAQVKTFQIPLISGTTKKRLNQEDISSLEYWQQCVQSTNQCHDISQVREFNDSDLFIVVGASDKSSTQTTWLASLIAEQSDWQTLLDSLIKLYLQGVTINWSAFDQEYQRHHLVLPTYPFQRQSYWLSLPSKTEVKFPETAGLSHTLLGRRIYSPLTTAIQFQTQLSLETFPFLADHLVYSKLVVPATVYLAMAIAATAEISKQNSCCLEEIVFLKALSFDESDVLTLQLILTPENNEQMSFQVFSLSQEFTALESNWILHVTGKVRTQPPITASLAQKRILADEIQRQCSQVSTGEQILYQTALQRGLYLGDSFQWIGSIWYQSGEALGEVQIPANISHGINNAWHPGLIDACLQMLNATLTTKTWDNTAYVPVNIDYLQVLFPPRLEQKLWAHALLHSDDESQPETLTGDIRLFDHTGQVMMEVGHLRVKSVSEKSLLTAPSQPLSDWLYQVQWQPAPINHGQLLELGQCLIFADEGGVGETLATRLQQQGQQCTLVYPGQDYRHTANEQIWLNPEEPEHWQRLWEDVHDNTLPLLSIIHLWSLDTQTPATNTANSLVDQQVLSCGSALYLIQTLVQQHHGIPSLQFVTRNAQAVTSQDAIAIAQSPLWGLVRTLSFEHPELKWSITDLEPVSSDIQASYLFQELNQGIPDEYVAYRGQERYLARLTKYQDLLTSPVPFALNPHATYLITGGLGDLGLEVASWMMSRGAKYIVLLSRRGRGAADARLVQLEQSDVQIVIAQADVAQYQQLAEVLQTINQTLPPLRGIIHAAGVLDDGVLMQQNWNRFAQVMAPKIQGAWNLHDLTSDIPLDFFVLFSSAASLVGAGGQSNYAASNAFLDAIAHYRQFHGLPGLSINWGPWAEMGMAARGERSEQRWQSAGIGQINPQMGVQLLEQLLQKSPPQIGVLPIDWRQFLQAFPSNSMPQLFSQLALGVETHVIPHQQSSTISQQLEQALPQQRENLLVEHLTNEIKQVLGLPASHVLKLRQGLFDMGMDSLMAVELKNRLQKNFKKVLPATLLFDYPSVEALTAYISQEVMGWFPEKSPVGTVSINEQQLIDPELTELETVSEDELSSLLTDEMAEINQLMSEDW